MNQTTGIIAALITLGCWTIGTFSFTKAAKLYAPVSVNRVRLLYALILLSFITCIIYQINPLVLFSKPVAMQWIWLGISGIIGLSIGDHFAFTAFKILGSSRTSLFNTFAPAAALVGGIFMLNENINIIGVIGMFISIIGIAWFIKSNAHNHEELDKKHLLKGVIYAVLGAICQGIGLVFAKKGLVLFDANGQTLSPVHATWIRMFVGVVFIYAMGLFKVNVWKELKDIKVGEKIVLTNQENNSWEGEGTFSHGWLEEGRIEPVSKNLTDRLEKTSSEFYRGFIRGIFDADGAVCSKIDKGISVRLSQVNLDRLHVVQRMLSRLGIVSTIYKSKKESCIKKMPNGEKKYKCLAIHDLVISKNNIELFFEKIGFSEVKKMKILEECVQSSKRNPYKERFTARIASIEKLAVEPVYDCIVDEVHCFDANGILAHNCGEISIAIWGAFCTIADVVPYHAETLEEAEDAFRCVTRALIRVNTMDSVYKKEVKRTNRIGVGITGIHEFAWKFFKLGFKDLIDEEKSKDFWMTMARFKRAVQDEAREYSKKIGVNVPHSDTTIKPAGCNSLNNEIKTNLGIISFKYLFNDIFSIDVENMVENSWFEVDKEIKIKDKNNEEKLITKLYCNGVKEVFEIEFEDGNVYKFTGNHQLLTSNRDWVRVDELSEFDDIISFDY